MVAWLQSQADLDANFFEGARKTLEKQNWDFFGGQLDKSVALTALGFVDGVCETIDQLALGAAQLGQLAFEGIEWGGNTLFKQKTPQWLKDDVTGAWNNVMAASEFGTRLIALDADAWNAVAKTGEKVGSDLASAIKTGDDYKIGGYLFDVATFVGPAAVGKLKYAEEAGNLAKLADAGDVASTVGKVEDGVKVVDKVSDVVKTSNILSYDEAEEIAFNAIKGSKRYETVVLGKFDDGGPTAYSTIARETGSQYFELDNWTELSSKYSEDEIWKINEKFLDIQTSSGREIYLSHDPNGAWGTSFYAKELKYLVDNGYHFVQEGNLWHAIR